MDSEYKDLLFKLLESHSILAQAMYDMNPRYNNEHYSAIVENQAIGFLTKNGLMDEFMKHCGDD